MLRISIERLTGMLFVTVLSLLVLGPVHAEDRRTDKDKLVVMTFNGEFLWDGRAPEEGQVNFAWKGDPVKADEHMSKVAAVIRANNPDIVNMVEVEGYDALKYFNDTFLADQGYVVYLKKGKDSKTGQDVGILTRIDPEGNMIKRDDRKGKFAGVEKSVSKNQYATFDMGIYKVALVGIHYLAIPTASHTVPKRNAQAAATRNLVAELQAAGYLIILTGDFNDFAYTVDDIQDNRPQSEVLKMLTEMGQGEADDLVNILKYAPPASRYTAHYDEDKNGQVDGRKELSAIDHMLLSKDLLRYLVKVEIDHSHDPTVVSDHFPVIAVLDHSAY